METPRSEVGSLAHLYVDWFDSEKHPEFTEWHQARVGKGLATWATMFPGDQFPDVFVGVDPSFNGEGTDSDMPEPYWGQCVAAAKERCPNAKSHVVVWITPDFE